MILQAAKSLRASTRNAVDAARFGYRATPRFFLASMVMAVVGPAALFAVPFAAKVLLSSLAEGEDASYAVVVAVLTAGATLAWVVAALDASISNSMLSRLEPWVVTRFAAAVSDTTMMAHLADPTSAEQVQMLRDGRYRLVQAPRALILVVRLAVRAVGLVLLLAYVSAWLPLLLVPAAGPFLAEWLGQRTRHKHEAARASDSLRASETFRVATSAESAGEVRVAGLYSELGSGHREASREIIAAERQIVRVELLLSIVAWMVFAACLVVGLSIALNDLDAGDIVLAILLSQIVGSQVIEGVPLINSFAASLQAVGRLTDLEAAVQAPEGEVASPDVMTKGISVENLSFTYPGASSPSLEDINIALPAGSSVAIVGENGAGKSTLVKLLTGLLHPVEGTIRVDDVPLSDLDRRTWFERTTAAFQDFMRYHLSLRQNVGVGNLDRLADDSAIAAALGSANASDLETELSEGLESMLAPGMGPDADLSGGQWQRVAIARAFMAERPLLMVLDEPTASLDAQTEHELFQAFTDAASGWREQTGAVTLFVTHRYTSLRRSDLILVMDKARLVESGSHDDLINAGGRYAELFETQAAGYR